METNFISAPSAELRILDLGSIRRIFIKGKAVHYGRLSTVLQTLDTVLKLSTIEELVKAKGDWWLDEIERRQDPKYLRARLETLVSRFGSFKEARVLDIGSGSGSSAFVMLDLGAAFIQGVEPNSKFVEIANSRAQDESLVDRVSFLNLQDTTSLPFEDARFDILTMNAVIEHIPPKIREAIIKEAYRCLKPGGLFVITETPNRAFPFDGHTTGLPFVPWLPLNMATSLAKKYSRHVPKNLTRDQYVSEGIVGGFYWQIKKSIPSAQCLNLKGGDAKWKSNLKKANPITFFLLALLERILNTCKLPLDAFMPMLDLVFRKN